MLLSSLRFAVVLLALAVAPRLAHAVDLGEPAIGDAAAPVTIIEFASLTCPHCASPELSWAPAAGTGTVVTWSVVHTKGLPNVTVGIVELDEGPWVQLQLVGDLPADLHDLRVRVAFEHPEGGEAVPVFTQA